MHLMTFNSTQLDYKYTISSTNQLDQVILQQTLFASYNLTSNAPWCVEFEIFDLSIIDVVDDLNAWELSS